jgi:hypothetical protein
MVHLLTHDISIIDYKYLAKVEEKFTVRVKIIFVISEEYSQI